MHNNILKIYFDNNRDLIPISATGPYRLKQPLHKEWQSKAYSKEEIISYSDRGYNLGFRQGNGDLIIDVDPRNGGNEGLEKLLADFKKYDPNIDDLGDVFPTVRTGGGGIHYYATIPPNVKVKNSIAEYGKGIEFKTLGRQVIIPGSVHPSGNLYLFDDFSDFDGPSQPIPDWLFRKIERVAVDSKIDPASGAEITPDELNRLLAHLPATDFNNNDSWMAMMAASHEATKGAGVDVFVQWSLSDTTYIGQEYNIRNRWNSFTPGSKGNIGIGTLYKKVIEYGGTLPDTKLGTSDTTAMGELPPAPVQVLYHDGHAKLEKDMGNLGILSNSVEIKNIIAQIARLDRLDQEKYLQELKKRTGRPLKVLRHALTKACVRTLSEGSFDIDDVALDITTYLLKNKFENGAHLIHGHDQRFWNYEKTHWVKLEDNIIDNLILKAAYQYRQKNPHVVAPMSSLITQGEKILKARRATKTNLNGTMEGLPPVVNTRNCEVWINPNTGDLVTQQHSPGSFLTTCLDVDFDPTAKCPIFSNALDQMFNQNKDGQEIVRHLWEIIGYLIQPQKDIATWVLFHGEGANGKTVVLNVITRLLGDAALNKSIDELDIKRYSHAFADLPNKLVVIDEDLDTKTILPDATLKKVSETKMLNANPKFRPSFKFLNTAIILFASNEYPKVKDLSHGMRRRAHIFNFNRKFKLFEQDSTLTNKIINNEMSGVLVEALKGFKRLRQRGGWLVPKSCEAARNQWLTKANSISEFIDDALEHSPGGLVEFKQLFNIYRLWCAEQGYTKPYTKPSFKKSFEALGIDIKRGNGNKIIVTGLALKKLDLDITNL